MAEPRKWIQLRCNVCKGELRMRNGEGNKAVFFLEMHIKCLAEG